MTKGRACSSLREGDTLVVWKLDGLGRNVKDLIHFVCELGRRGIGFVSLTESIDTAAASGRFFFHVMASLAQLERELMIERTQAGLAAAREQGRVGARKRLMTASKMAAARKLLGPGHVGERGRSQPGSVPTLYSWVPASAR
ncbi:recombinase family protein [Arthrobacter hankyongi]|uniref:recombinase family protein n=1 Tax=Arthrobacter hankyongi TaxID=2904801 RepID=UPI0027E1D773|nr:recombinase family protein [Arthrobacter hankyongi]